PDKVLIGRTRHPREIADGTILGKTRYMIDRRSPFQGIEVFLRAKFGRPTQQIAAVEFAVNLILGKRSKALIVDEIDGLRQAMGHAVGKFVFVTVAHARAQLQVRAQSNPEIEARAAFISQVYFEVDARTLRIIQQFVLIVITGAFAFVFRKNQTEALIDSW